MLARIKKLTGHLRSPSQLFYLENPPRSLTSNLTNIEYDLILGVFSINNSVEDSGALSDLLKVSSHANEVNKAVSFYSDIWSFV